MTFAAYVFLSHFFSTVYFYTKIFLVGKAQLTKSKPRHVRQDGVQIRENDVPQENRLSYRSDNRDNCGDNQGSPSDNQGDSSKIGYEIIEVASQDNSQTIKVNHQKVEIMDHIP